MEADQTFADSVAEEIGISSEPQAPESAPEPVAEAPAPAQFEQPRPAESKTIPLASLHRERERWQREVNDLKAEMAKIAAATAPKPVPPPNPAEQPLEYLAWQEEQRQKQTAEHETKAEAEKRERAESERHEQVVNYYAEAADEARDAVPDFDDAYSHLTRWGDQQLKMQGYRNPMQRAQMLQQHEFDLVSQAMHQGFNPAEVIYRKAWEHGYQGRQQAPAPQPAPMMQQSAPAPQPAPPRDPATGQFQPSAPTRAAPKSLSSVAGVPGGQPLDGKSIADMDVSEFDRTFLDPRNREAWRNMHKRK